MVNRKRRRAPQLPLPESELLSLHRGAFPEWPLVIAGRSDEGPFAIRFAELRYRALPFVEFTTEARASRLRASSMEARVTKVSRVFARFSKY